MRYHREPGTSWLRFTPQHFYCRNCGVEIRPTLLPLGRFAWVLMVALYLVAAFATFSQLSLGTFDRYRHFAIFLWVLLCFLLSLVIVFWGTRFCLAGEVHQSGALSNNRWRGP